MAMTKAKFKCMCDVCNGHFFDAELKRVEQIEVCGNKDVKLYKLPEYECPICGCICGFKCELIK